MIFASSNHAVGFYRQDQTIDATAPQRPDGYYGLSKSFGEDVAQFYWNRYGIQSASLRIGSAFPGSEVREIEVKGRNLSEGVPRSFTISSNEILEALTDPLNQMVSAVKNALEQTPPELAADQARQLARGHLEAAIGHADALPNKAGALLTEFAFALVKRVKSA